jgi:pimeloyl-ACP methyl ester carboxylesterase
VVLHGGPGSGTDRGRTRLLDPAAHRIVLFDQRGCGRSTPDVADPAVPLDAHTTHDLVADIERLRVHRLVTHCWRHAAWLADDELVIGARRLAGMPGVLVHGRADVSSPPEFAWRVHGAWPGSELVLVDGAGHGMAEGMIQAVVAATDRFRPPASPA